MASWQRSWSVWDICDLSLCYGIKRRPGFEYRIEGNNEEQCQIDFYYCLEICDIAKCTKIQVWTPHFQFRYKGSITWGPGEGGRYRLASPPSPRPPALALGVHGLLPSFSSWQHRQVTCSRSSPDPWFHHLFHTSLGFKKMCNLLSNANTHGRG